MYLHRLCLAQMKEGKGHIFHHDRMPRIDSAPLLEQVFACLASRTAGSLIVTDNAASRVQHRVLLMGVYTT